MVHTRHMHCRWPVLTAIAVVAALLGSGCTKGTTANPPGNKAGAGAAGIGPEVDAARQPSSTFAIDIDNASYLYARRLILNGDRPARNQVRPEEFVNAFRQDYPQPPGDGFTVFADGSHMPRTDRSGSTTRLLRIGLQTRAEDPQLRPDAALTFVIDVSGSMGETGKLDLVKDALHTLVDQLRDSDEVAIVAYDSQSRVLREMAPVNSRTSLHRIIDRLRAGGSTNLEAGLLAGYKVARAGYLPGGTNRVILLSDGLPNVGNTTAAPILRTIREEAAKKISLLGVGVGSDYGDQFMEQLVDAGDGFVTYVSERAQARDLFVYRLPATLAVRALDAKVQVTFDPSTVASYRLVGYEDRALAASQFRDDRVDGGEVGPGHSVTALYVLRLRGDDGEEFGSGWIGQARVRWLDPVSREALEKAVNISLADLDGDFAGASPRLQVCYVAGFFAELLRGSPYGEQVSPRDLEAEAEQAFHATGDPQVAELADLIRRAS
jgi:Ca-activated chloride channel homolog